MDILHLSCYLYAISALEERVNTYKPVYIDMSMPHIQVNRNIRVYNNMYLNSASLESIV
jgi:hypothetical protein